MAKKDTEKLMAKVVEGLQCCIAEGDATMVGFGCRTCPYRVVDDYGCCNALRRDALQMLLAMWRRKEK